MAVSHAQLWPKMRMVSLLVVHTSLSTQGPSSNDFSLPNELKLLDLPGIPSRTATSAIDAAIEAGIDGEPYQHGRHLLATPAPATGTASLHYLPNDVCGFVNVKGTTSDSYIYNTRAKATKACTDHGCIGLAKKGQLNSAYYPIKPSRQGYCARGWTASGPGGSNRRWLWMGTNKCGGPGFVSNTAVFAGAYCIGCPNIHESWNGQDCSTPGEP